MSIRASAIAIGLFLCAIALLSAQAEEYVLPIARQDRIDASLEEIRTMRRDAVDRLDAAIVPCVAAFETLDDASYRRCRDAMDPFLSVPPLNGPSQYLANELIAYLNVSRNTAKSQPQRPRAAPSAVTRLAEQWRKAIAERIAPKADTIGDDALKRYAASPYDKAAMMGKHEILGYHHGVPVVVDFVCADLCPQMTHRIIHYDLDTGDACKAAGGVTEDRTIPGIVSTRRRFCIPAPLADPDRGRDQLRDRLKDFFQ